MSMPLPNPLPEPLELMIRGKEADLPVAYACAVCGIVVSPKTFGGGPGAHEEAIRLTKEHCFRRCECGAEPKKGWTICDVCRDKKEEEREAKKYAIAQKVDEVDYEDPVYWEGHQGSMGDGYFGSTDELRDYCEDEGIEVPAYVWACNPVELSVSVDHVLESAFAEHYEDARDTLSADAEKELETLIASWCKKQNIQSWHTDYTKVVLLDMSIGSG